MKRPIKKMLFLVCGVISVAASLLSIVATLGYLQPVKRALNLP